MKKKSLLKILSYNIHKGFGVRNKTFILAKIRDAIRITDADVVFLQEVLGQHDQHARRIRQWPTEPQFEFLADSVWPHYAYGKNAVYDAGHHGNAILSKLPISEWSNFNISTNRFENRGLLHAIMSKTGHREEIHCMCAHLGLLRSGRTIQLKRILERIDQEVPHAKPLILAGDFNDWTERATYTLEQHIGLREAFREKFGKHPRTFPSKFPMLKLDRIYFRDIKLHFACVLRGKLWEKLSDHSPLYAEFEI